MCFLIRKNENRQLYSHTIQWYDLFGENHTPLVRNGLPFQKAEKGKFIFVLLKIRRLHDRTQQFIKTDWHRHWNAKIVDFCRTSPISEKRSAPWRLNVCYGHRKQRLPCSFKHFSDESQLTEVDDEPIRLRTALAQCSLLGRKVQPVVTKNF